jgi:hypothetical protein
MKLLIACLLIFRSAIVFGQPIADSIMIRSKELVEKSKTTVLTTSEKRELIKNAFYFQNKGFVLEENAHDYQGSLEQIDRALFIWLALRDTLSEANLRKYRGFLLAHLNHFPEGKSEINHAIALYTEKEKEFGIAVSQFNFSRLYEFENNLDSAFYFAFAALKYWETQTDTFRILTINNQLINLYLKSGNLLKAGEIQDSSEKLLKAKDLHWLPVIDFYFLSYRFFDRNKKSDQAKKYKKLYSDKIESLRTNEIEAKSSYDLS